MLLIYGTLKVLLSKGVVSEMALDMKALFQRLAVFMLITLDSVYTFGYLTPTVHVAVSFRLNVVPSGIGWLKDTVLSTKFTPAGHETPLQS